MIADESDIHSIDDYLNFETPKKNSKSGNNKNNHFFKN